jgi:hypothetical protein
MIIVGCPFDLTCIKQTLEKIIINQMGGLLLLDENTKEEYR